MRRLRQTSWALTIVWVLGASITLAQGTCPAVVQQAIEQVGSACATIGRNEACYGNNAAVATDLNSQVVNTFSSPGNLTDVTHLTSLLTYGLNPEDSTWGIAMVALQANLPDAIPGQNVVFILLGGVQLTSEANAPTPGMGAGGENAAPPAFRLITGIVQPACAEAPPDGLLIQSPEGATVNLTINGVGLHLGSTAFVTAPSSDEVNLAVLGGQVTMTSGGQSVTVNPGFSTSAREGQPPSQPQPSTGQGLQALPLNLLPGAVNVPQPQVTVQAGTMTTPASGTPLPPGPPPPSGTSIRMVICAAQGTAHANAGAPVTIRLGWSEVTLQELNNYANGVTETLTYDGAAVPLSSLTGPAPWVGDQGPGFAYWWAWVIASPSNGQHTLVWNDNKGNTLTCKLIVGG